MTTLTRLNSDMGDILLTNLNTPAQDCTVTMPVVSGKSAYDLAVENGYVGSLQDWLASLSGWKPVDSDFANYLEQHLQLSALFNGVNSKIEANKAELDTRIEERISEARAISTKLDNEAQERIKKANELSKQLLDETAQRVADTSKLRDDLQSEAYERALAMDQLADDILSEQVNRVNEIKDTVDLINQEVAARASAIDVVTDNLLNEQKARQSGISALVSDMDSLDSKVNSNHTFILENYSTTSDANTETANQIKALKTTYIDPELNKKATVTSVEQVENSITNINGELVTVGNKLSGVIAESGKNKQDIAAVWTDMQVRVTNESAMSTRIDNVVATTYDHDARIVAETKARTDADSVMASDISAMSTRVGNTEGKITTLEEITSNTDSTVSQVSTKLDGLVKDVAGKANASALNDYYTKAATDEVVSKATTKLTAEYKSEILDSLTIKDTRDTNELPRYYWANHPRKRVIEFKVGSSIGYPLGFNWYGTLETTVPWQDISGGAIQQVFKSEDNLKTATRHSIDGDNWSNWKSDINDLTSLVNTKASSSALSNLESTVNRIDGKVIANSQAITSLEGSIETVNNNLSTKASGQAVSDLTNRVTQTEKDISSNSNSITTLNNSVDLINGDLATRAKATAVSELSNRVDKTESSISSNSAAITTLNNTVSGKADSTAMTALSNRVTDTEAGVVANTNNITHLTNRVGTTEGKITGLEEVTTTTNSSLSQVSKKLDNLVTTVDGKASSQALNDVSSRVSKAEGTLTSQGQSITKLTNDLDTTNNAVNTKASADSVSALTNRVSETEGKVTSNSNALTALTNRVTTTEGDITKKADASVLVDYYTKTKADEAIAGEIRNYDANLKIGGTNLYHESLLIAGCLLAEAGVPWGGFPDAHDPNYYPCKPNEKFAGTFYDLNGVTSQGGAGYLCFYDADKNFISGTPWIVRDVFKTTYITAPLRTAYYRYATHAKGVKAKLEYGTKATDWSPSDVDIKKTIDVNASAISGLTTRVTTAEGNITSQGTSITNLQNSISAINNSLSTKADSSALSTLDNRVTSIDGRVTTNANSITTLQGNVTTINNNLATKANASALSNYYTKAQADSAISGKVDEFKSTYSETILPTDKDISRANTWSRIVYSKKAPYISENVIPDYSYLVNYKKHSEDYFTEGNTMAVPVDNSISYYRAVITVSSAKVINLGNLTGDDAHAVYVDNVKVHSASSYSTNPCSFSVTAGEHIIDIIVNNGGGNAGFSSTNTLSSQVDSMYAVKLVYKDTELNATAISNTYTKAEADSVTTSKIEAFKSSYVDNELGKKFNASAINNYFNKAETNQAITTATTELNASLAKKVNNDDIPSIVELSQTGKRHLVSTVGLDVNTYYPVCFNVDGKKSRITMSVSLGQSQASWATHGAGWSGHIEVTQRAGRWGSNDPDITIERFAYYHCAQSPVIRVGQIWQASKAIFYLRGGTEYFFYVDNNVGNPELYTSRQVFYEDYGVYCEPIAYDKSLEPKSFKTEIQNNASALTTLKAEVKEVDGRVVATASRLDTVSTTVGNHTASIQQHSESIDGIKTNWTLRLNSNGRVSGMTLMNDGRTSEFAIEADNFYVGAIDSAYKPFQVKTVGWTGVDGRSYPSGVYINNAIIGDLDAKVIRAGTITGDKIKAGSITGDKIEAGSITADRIQIGSLGRDRLDNSFTQSIDDTKSKIDNLQVGGRNLAIGQDFNILTSKAGWSRRRLTILSNQLDPFGGQSAIKATSIGVDSSIYIVDSGYRGNSLSLMAEEGGTYTLSVYMRSDTPRDFTIRMTSRNVFNNVKLTDKWQKYTVTAEHVAGQLVKIELGGYSVWNSSDEQPSIYFSHLKYEKGNKATDWTPAPEDVQDGINTVDNKVKDIFDDNKITPDEKQTLLVTYKQIANDNDIWRNQAYLIGLDYTRQVNAVNTVLSGSRPYLGWVCRSDALTQTDTLNAGERTTLMNAISEYHAANQDLAQRVGSNLRTTGQNALSTANTANGAAATAQNRADSAYNSANYLERYDVDLDSYKTTGKYFVRSLTQGEVIPGTDNELKRWMYLVVDGAVPERITQTAWHDQTPDKVWTRVWVGYWQPWKRQTDTQHVKNLIGDPNVNTIAAGARDLLNRWKANGNGTLYIDDQHIAVNKIGANEIAAGAINADHIYGDSITGDKIKANTEINAPKIKGGEININENFKVDSQGNLTARSGTFEGTVLAENISGTIDVASLKKSAWMGGYNLHLKHGGYIDYATYRPTVIPSRGAILSTFPEFFQVAELTYTIHLETKYALNITQFLSRVDDTLDINVYQYGSLTYTIKYTSGNRREISIPLPKGFCTLEFKVKNTKGGASGLVLLGDFVDNDAIKFA